MGEPTKLGSHAGVSRRRFLQLSAVGATGLTLPSLWAEGPVDPLLASAVDRLEYLTSDEQFASFGRGKPPPHKLPPEKRRQVGLARETWQLEVVPDPESNCKVDAPLSKKLRTALTWGGLMDLAKEHAVRFLAVMSCTNRDDPCGMGLWEGVPLRDVLWLTRPTGNVRRVFYYGYHNDDAEQRFQSSLSVGRVLEDAPGELPVLLCYKLNGKWLSAKGGGPVRLLVPGEYGNKSVKWLQRVVLTNSYQANDTYAQWNNDTESSLKTCARFVHPPPAVKAGQPIAVTGLAQVGISGLRQVEYWLHREGDPLPADDPHFTKANWKAASILPPPTHWGGGLPGGKLPPVPWQFDPATGKPREWPLRQTIVHWAARIRNVPPGRYDLRCRTVDANGAAQPMPRPFPKAGRNAIQRVSLVVEG